MATRGASALSVTLGVSENNLLSFEMYPNPVSDLLNIQLPTGTDKAEVAVFDYTGRLVSSKTISSNDTAIDVQQISKGIYMIRMLPIKLGYKDLLKNSPFFFKYKPIVKAIGFFYLFL